MAVSAACRGGCVVVRCGSTGWRRRDHGDGEADVGADAGVCAGASVGGRAGLEIVKDAVRFGSCEEARSAEPRNQGELADCVSVVEAIAAMEHTV